MSRDSPRRHRDSPQRPLSRSRRDSDEFVEQFSRLLVARDQEFNALQDQKVAELQDEHTKKLEDSIVFHEAQRAQAVAELDCYRQNLVLVQQNEIRRARQLQLQQAEQARNIEEERQRHERAEADRILDAEKRRLDHEKQLMEKREEREALQRQKVEAEAARQQPVVNGTVPAASPSAPKPLSNGTTPVAALNAISKSPATTTLQPQHRQAEPPRMEPPQTVSTQPIIAVHVQGKDAVHQRYLDLHKRLKVLRSSVKKAVPSLKDWTSKRLVLKKTFGQLVSDSDPEATDLERQKVRAANMLRRKEIIAILSAAKSAPGPTVDARDYIIRPQSDLSHLDAASCQVPALYIYLYNFCAKAGINTIKSTEPPVVEIVGITLAFVFGINDLRFQNESFIDILLAKYHFVSPMLFGIYGPENTERGRMRLGWPHQAQGTKKLWIEEKTFFEEQQYLAVGWAALTLRDFAKAKTSRNACPPFNFWASIAAIVNTAPEAVTRVHFIVLKSLLQNHADKFVKFYGRAATVALRTAIVDFPRRQGVKATTEKAGVEFLKDGLKKRFGILL